MTVNVWSPDRGIDEVFREDNSRSAGGVDWMPDERALVFVRGQNQRPLGPAEDPPSIWMIGREDRTPRPLGIAMDGLRNVRVSPDGRYLTFTAGWASQEVTVLEHFLPR